MLRTMFQDNRQFGSREEDFLRVLPYMGMEAILFEGTFVPRGLASICPVASAEKMFEIDGRRTTDDGCLPIL